MSELRKEIHDDKLRKIAEDFDFIQISVECINTTTKREHISKSCRLIKLLMTQEKGTEYYLKN